MTHAQTKLTVLSHNLINISLLMGNFYESLTSYSFGNCPPPPPTGTLMMEAFKASLIFPYTFKG